MKWTLIFLVFALLGSVLHYTLPRHDVVRVVGIENRRVSFDGNSFFWSSASISNAADNTRDVRFIQGVRPNGRPIVYRNEDTGWGWPPYFKMNSASLQATAQDAVSTAETPRWMIVTRYGWRNEFFSIFPNALKIRAATGPDQQVIPWSALLILAALLLLTLWFVVLWRRFRLRRVEPAMARLDNAVDRADASLDEARDNVKRGWRRMTDWITGTR